jgi:hypothetical protein
MLTTTTHQQKTTSCTTVFAKTPAKTPSTTPQKKRPENKKGRPGNRRTVPHLPVASQGQFTPKRE